MAETTDRLFIEFSAEKLEQMAGRIAACLDKLSYEQVWLRHSENENAVGNLVLHLCGNLRQWIGTGVAGKPDVRVRDREFAARGDIQVGELKERLAGAAEDAAGIIRGVTAERLTERVTVQGYEKSVLEVIYHVVEHFCGHAGQIIFATKLATGEDMGFYRHLGKAAHAEKTP
ncbi:MAG: DUF1572 domain-containing protein [Acidimicrobiia bacterium]|nr:DUF1572 domain-containing protein [Acidimicrobiia bacterium]